MITLLWGGLFVILFDEVELLSVISVKEDTVVLPSSLLSSSCGRGGALATNEGDGCVTINLLPRVLGKLVPPLARFQSSSV